MNETIDPNSTASKLEDYVYRLRSIEYVPSYHSELMKQQLALSYFLIIVTNGKVKLLINRREIEMNRDSVYVGLPGDTYGAVNASEGLELYVFHFELYTYSDEPSSSVYLTLDKQELQPNGKIMMNLYQELATICENLYRKWNCKEQQDLFRCQIDFQEMIYNIYRGQGKEGMNSSSAIEQAKQFIEEHYTEALSIEQLAQMTKVSPKYFVDLFKRKYGKSAMEYTAELRLKEAKRLMAHADLKLREIAHRVGYGDEFYFSRKFKKEIGVSPTVYMQQRCRRVAVYQAGLIGYMAALHLMPLAAPVHPKWTEYYYQEYRDQIPIHLSAYRYNRDWKLNMKLLQQHQADLIFVIDDMEEQERQALEQVASNLCFVPSDLNWRDQLHYIADQLGESWQAERWLSEYEHQVQEAKTMLHPVLAQETIMGLRMIHDQLYLYCNRGMAEIWFHDLELMPAYDHPTVSCDHPITLKQLNDLNPDRIFMLVRQDTETIEHWTHLQNNSQWQEITAVHRKRLHLLSSDPWREYSAHAQFRMLNQLVSLLPVDHPL